MKQRCEKRGYHNLVVGAAQEHPFIPSTHALFALVLEVQSLRKLHMS